MSTFEDRPLSHAGRSLVISASRTKDVVRWSPDALADVLLGRRPCRFGWSGEPLRLDLDEIHTLVLWTKDPGPMVQCTKLKTALEALVGAGGQIYLQLTATGFGDTFVEYGVPRASVVCERLDTAIEAGLLAPGAVKLRYDPLIRIRAGDCMVTNVREALFRQVVDAFAPLGVQDVVTSYVDFETYPKVKRRIEDALGLSLEDVPRNEIAKFVQWMARQCEDRGMRFDTCASPRIPFEREGCIAGSRLNALMATRHGPGAPRCTTQLHNERAHGGQRADCRCTYSRDIGYSAGFTTCYTHGSGCIYCYSHRESMGPKLLPQIRAEVAELLSDPPGFLAKPDREAYLGVVSG